MQIKVVSDVAGGTGTGGAAGAGPDMGAGAGADNAQGSAPYGDDVVDGDYKEV